MSIETRSGADSRKHRTGTSSQGRVRWCGGMYGKCSQVMVWYNHYRGRNQILKWTHPYLHLHQHPEQLSNLTLVEAGLEGFIMVSRIKTVIKVHCKEKHHEDEASVRAVLLYTPNNLHEAKMRPYRITFNLFIHKTTVSPCRTSAIRIPVPAQSFSLSFLSILVYLLSAEMPCLIFHMLPEHLHTFSEISALE